MLSFLCLNGSAGACQCCETPEGVRHLDVDVGFVCTDCFIHLSEVGAYLHELTLLQAAMEEEMGEDWDG